jgi:chemotaxis protein MotB
VPNKISIEGHTDALRMSGQKITNWELSTARASAARIALTQAGVPSNRLTAVTGYADTQPLPGTEPTDPQNRRISIMIWDDDKAPPSAVPPTPAAGARPEIIPPSAARPIADRPASATPPSLPRPAARPPAPPPPPKTQQQLESELIDNSMQRAATDRSTVGPPQPVTPPED